MPDSGLGEFQSARLKPMIAYYHQRAVKNRWWHNALSLYVLVVSIALSPVIAFADSANRLGRLTIAVFTASLALGTGLMHLFHFYDNWIRYRTACEALTREHSLFIANAGPYKEGTSHQVFAERVEEIIHSEGTNWRDLHTQSESKEKTETNR